MTPRWNLVRPHLGNEFLHACPRSWAILCYQSHRSPGTKWLPLPTSVWTNRPRMPLGETLSRARGRVTLGRRAFSCNAPALARVLGPRANLPLTTIAAASFGGSPLARGSGPLTGCRSARGAESSRRWWRRDCLKLESKAGVYI